MLMPCAGFDVVPSDCLALHLARRVRGTRRLVLFAELPDSPDKDFLAALPTWVIERA
jgi:hypothetical protein